MHVPPYVCLALVGAIVACMQPLTRYTNAEGEASQYTYHVVRSATSMLCGLMLIAATAEGGLREVVGTSRTRPWFLCIGVSQWFFLWGYVHAAQEMDGATWATLHYCAYPVFASFVAVLAFAEVPPWGFFAYACVRNAVIIVLLLEGGGKMHSTMAALAFPMITAAGSGSITAILRNLRGMSPFIPMVWSDALNTLLWIPPGLFGVRVTGLWPNSETGDVTLKHNLDLEPIIWVGLALTGMCGAGIISCTGYAVRYIDAAYAATFTAPLAIVFAVVAGLFGKSTPSFYGVVGIVLFCACSLVEVRLGVWPAGTEPEYEYTRINDEEEPAGEARAKPR